MMDAKEQLSNVSDTALIIAYVRGKESQRDDAKFQDPLATQLYKKSTEDLIHSSNKRLTTRLLSKSLSNSIVVRTVLIDELIHNAISKHSIKRVVNLGSGLDTRAYRMNLPDDLEWVDVDLEDVIRYKKEQLKSEEPSCKITYKSKDISKKEELESLFSNELSKDKLNTLVLTEGLLVYLTEEEVIDLSQVLSRYDFIKQWVADVYSPFAIRVMQRAWSRQLGKKVNFFFGTKDSKQFFSLLGWSTDQFLPVFEHNERIGRTSALNVVRKGLALVFGSKFKKLVARSSVVLALGKTE